MVLFSIILTVVIAAGVISFKAQITDSADTEPSAGCAGLLLLAAAFIAILVLATREFGHNPRTLLFVVLPIGAIVAALYSPFITSVFSSFFERVLFPSGGGEIKRHDIAQKLTSEGRYSEAVAEYQKAIEADPIFGSPYYYVGSVYYTLGEYDKALIEYRKFMRYSDDYAEVEKVGLENVDIVGNNSVGAFAGKSDGKISNVYSNGTINGCQFEGI